METASTFWAFTSMTDSMWPGSEYGPVLVTTARLPARNTATTNNPSWASHPTADAPNFQSLATVPPAPAAENIKILFITALQPHQVGRKRGSGARSFWRSCVPAPRVNRPWTRRAENANAVHPYHFGVGIAAKAALVRRFSLGLFVVLQVIIDLESLYNLAYQRVPVHRFLHTFVGATLLAGLSSAVLLGFLMWWQGRAGGRTQRASRLFVWLLATALFATWSHVVLDAMMHQDVQPFWPLTDLNPFLFVVPVRTLHLGCVVLGFFGTVALGFQWLWRANKM